MNVLVALACSPGRGAVLAAQDARLPLALVLVAVATAISAAHVARYASEVTVEDVVFGAERAPFITALLGTIGRDLTSVVVYVIERSWDALLVTAALSPILIWILGATAIHAAARLDGSRRPFTPILVLVGLATGLTRPVADLSGLLFGPRGAGGMIAQILGTAALVWLAALLWHSVRAHYGVGGMRAATILAVALVLFYVAPFTLILLALIAVLVSAILLEYFPAK